MGLQLSRVGQPGGQVLEEGELDEVEMEQKEVAPEVGENHPGLRTNSAIIGYRGGQCYRFKFVIVFKVTKTPQIYLCQVIICQKLILDFTM